MSLSTTSSRMPPYVGNNSTATFPYTFKVFDGSDIYVVETDADGFETVLTYNVNFTVTGVGNRTGGNVIRTAGNLPTDYTWTIMRVRALSQLASIKNQTEFFANIHEDVWDKIVMICQQIQEQVDRSLKLALSFDINDFNPTLPTTLEANRMLMISETGAGFALGPTPEELSAAADNVNDAEAAAVTAVAAAATASGAATTASNHVITASRWAKQDEDVTVVDAATSVDSGLYSALHYAAKAEASAVSAAASALDAAAGATVSGSRGAPNNITAGGGITYAAAALTIMFVQGSGGAVTISANPQISAGTVVGQRLFLKGRSDTNTLSLANGNGMSLNGDIVLGDDDEIELWWDGTYWQESNRRK